MTDVDYSKLASYFSNPQVPSSRANEIAKFILLNADVKRGDSKLPAQNQPSLMGRIFDILSRPRYAVANAIKGAVERGDLPNIYDVGSGLSGTQKTSYTDVLKSAGMEEGPLRTILGLGLDITADPVNFIPVGGAIKGAANLIRGAKGAKGIPEASSLQKLLKSGDPINPELYGLSKSSKVSIPNIFKTAPTEPNLPRNIFPRDTTVSKTPVFVKNQLELDIPGVKTKPFYGPIDKAVDEASFALKDAKHRIETTKGQLALKLDLPKIGKPASQIISDASRGSLPDAARISTARGNLEFEPRHAALADEIIKKFNPNKSTASLNKAHPDTLNAKQQVWLYYRALNAAKVIAKNPKWVASHGNKIYAAIESSLRAKGLVPRLGSGENVSLYDTIRQMGGPQQYRQVLDNFTKDLSPKNPIWDAVQGLRAAGAVDEAKSVQFILDKAAEARSTLAASGTLSHAGEKTAVRSIINIAKQAAKIAPISPASEDATQKLLNQVLHAGKSPAQVAIEAKAGIIDDILAGAVRADRPTVNHALTMALEKNLGKLPAWSIDNKAVEFFMGRVATWWGQKDLRPLSLTASSSSQATAAARGKALNNLFKGYDSSQRAEAMAIAQGLSKPSSIHTARLADEIIKMMSNLTSQVSGSSVITRSAVDMRMLNKWMRNYGTDFEFTNSSKIRDVTGKLHDYSKGTDWLNSWRTAEIKGDPQAWLFRVNQAMEQATREKALFDEIGERFGQKIPGGGFNTKVTGHPYIANYSFPKEIAQQLPRVIKDWTNPVKMSDSLMRHYDRLLSMWKSGVTIYRPAHHIRNLIGDAYLGWMDGVDTIKPYMLAARVQRTMKDAYPTLSDVDKLVELGVVSRNLSTPRVGEVLFRNKSGVPFTAQQIGAVAHQKGLLEHAKTIEDIIDLGETSRFKPFGGRVQAVGRAASELIGHNSRLAHFIDKVMKSHGSNLENIFEQASRRARKWHPTGLDLTDFEKKFMRRVIPFYAWLRKSTPLLLEGLVMNPGKVLAAPKVYGGIQELAGIQTNGIDDPFPTDQMFPEWLRAEGLGPLSTSDGWLSSLSNQDPSGYVMAGQGLNPLASLIAQVSQPGKTILGGLTPAAQIPLSLASGQNLSTGVPISGIDAKPGAMQEYIGSQIPIWSMAQSMTGITPFGTPTKKGATTEALVNYLTAAGIHGTGPYIRQAKYERDRPGQVQRQAARQAFLEQLRGSSDNI